MKMYMLPINYNLSNNSQVKKNKKQNISFKKNDLLSKLDDVDNKFLKFLGTKKANRYLNITLISLIAILGFQVKNIFDKVQTQIESTQITPLIKDFDTQERALNYSIGQITYYLNAEHPREYSVHINNKRHSIITEFLGNDSTVVTFAPKEFLYNWATTLDYSYTSLHGHPQHKNGATSTFSFQDFKTFTNKENCSATYVVNNDGKYCRLEKTDEYKKISQEELAKLEYEFEEANYYSWECRKVIYNKKGELVLDLVDYPGMHDFMDRIAKRYGMKYVTTYGTYGLYGDVYSKGYHEGFYDKFEVIED